MMDGLWLLHQTDPNMAGWNCKKCVVRVLRKNGSSFPKQLLPLRTAGGWQFWHCAIIALFQAGELIQLAQMYS